jgi:hypothetical protein
MSATSQGTTTAISIVPATSTTTVPAPPTTYSPVNPLLLVPALGAAGVLSRRMH